MNNNQVTFPKRHRFQFSLRTLLAAVMLIAIIGGGLAYHLNWIRQREAWRISASAASNALRANIPNDPPGLLWIFGERGESWIELNHGTDEQLAQAQRLFPEAIVIIRGQQPTAAQTESYRRMFEKALRSLKAPVPASSGVK